MRAIGSQAVGMPQVTAITDDAELLDEILRIAAAAGVPVHVDAQGSRMHWQRAALVLIDAAQAARVGRLGLPRRPGVLVITRESAVPDRVWPEALGVGAEHVVSLPDGERWLITRMRQMHDGPSRQGQIIAVMGACGGAGVSTLACGLARAAHANGHDVLLIDADPFSAGIDLILGADQARGSRWADVVTMKGRMHPQSLRDALPSVQGITVLAPDRERATPLTAEAMTHALDAGAKAFDRVIIDLPCAMAAEVDVALAHAASTIFVTPAQVIAACRAKVVAQYVMQHSTALHLVVRTMRDGLDAAVIAEALDLPLAHTIEHRPRVVEAINTAEPPDIDEVFAKACHAIVQPTSQGVAA